MLVLTRRVDEKIILPDLDVTVQVVAIKANQVRLGISAPSNVRVFREELLPAAAPGLGGDAQLQARLASCTADLDQLRRQISAGRREGLADALSRLDSQLRSLQQQFTQMAVS